MPNNNSVELKVVPIIDPGSLKQLEKQLDQLNKMGKPQSGQTETAAKASKTANEQAAKADAAWKKGDFKGFNDAVGLMIKSMKELVLSFSTSDRKLHDSFMKLENSISKAQSVLAEAAKEEARLLKIKEKSGNQKAPEAAAYQEYQKATGQKIGLLGRGQKLNDKGEATTFARTQKGVEQTVTTLIKQGEALGKSWREIVDDFKKQHGILGDIKSTDKAGAIKEVGSQYTSQANQYLDDQISKQRNIQAESGKTVTDNVEKQTALITQIEQLNPEVKELIAVMKQLISLNGQARAATVSNSTNEGAAAGQQQQGEAAKGATEELNQMTSSLNKNDKSYKRTILSAFGYGTALRMLKQVCKQAIQTVTELDKSLTTQAMVSGKTRQQTYALLQSYQKLADQCGATTTEVAEVATAYFRQGKSVSDALTMTETAVKAAKVAGISTKESVDYLTTAVNGFQLAAEDAMAVSDKFAALASQAAVSYDELATALSKVASQANLAGMSMDYTLALLTKGIETTRESAESIGTALKTILARMREISDYGATLSDGTNINNVETQLSYVNIKLRESSGELRSTEDVLQELGGKWDSLSSNQQAAIAKALAGTRQQSRLIAMMQDYQRTTELTVISQRSLGATEAQMAEYMSGMEAATNRVTTAYQALVEQLTNSDVIIGIVNGVADVLNAIADFMDNVAAKQGVMIALASILTTILITTINTKLHQKEQNQILQEQELKERKKNLEIQKENNLKAITAKQEQVAALKQQANLIKQRIEKNKSLKVTLLQKKADGTITADEKAQLAIIDARVAKDESLLSSKEAQIKTEEIALQTLQAQGVQYDAQIGQIDTQLTMSGKLLGVFGNILGVLTPIAAIYQLLVTLGNLMLGLKQKEWLMDKKIAIQKKINAAWQAMSSASWIPYVGWAIGAAIVGTILGITIVKAVNKAKGNQETDEDKAEKARKNIQNLTQDIYNLNKSAQAIDTVATKFDALNRKLIKTQDEINEINSLLDSLKDQGFSDEEVEKIKNIAKTDTDAALALIKAGSENKKNTAAVLNQEKVRQAAILDQYGTAADKAEANKIRNEAWLQDVQRQAAASGVSSENQSILNTFLANASADGVDQEKLKQSVGNALKDKLTSSTDWIEKIPELMASDEFKDVNAGSLIFALMSGDTAKLSELLNDNQLASLMEAIGVDTTYTYDSLSKDFIDNLDKDSYGYMKQLMSTSSSDWSAYQTAWTSLGTSLEGSIYNLKDMFPQFQSIFDNYGDAFDDFAKAGLTIQDVSDLSNLFSTTEGIDDAQTAMVDFAKWLGGTYVGAIEDEFSDPELISKITKIIGTPISKATTRISNLKDKKKNMDEALSKYMSGEATSGELYEELSKVGLADKTYKIDDKEYSAMELAMKGEYGKLNELLDEAVAEEQKQLTDDLKDQQKLLDLEIKAYEKMASLDEEQAEKLRTLKGELAIVNAQITEAQDAMKDSLADQIEIENQKVDIYKDYLKKQAEAEKKYLENMKEAYQKYFEEINQSAEDEDYYEKRDKLLTNMSKVGAGTDATSLNALATMQENLRKLAKEREETLRQRAQDALIEGIDNQIKNIDTQLKNMTETTSAILDVIKTKGLSTEEVAGIGVFNSIQEGSSALDLISKVSDLSSALNVDTSSVISNTATKLLAEGATIERTANSVYLNVNGTKIDITEQQNDSLFKTIISALEKNGVGVS